jgi:hypothetical protein
MHSRKFKIFILALIPRYVRFSSFYVGRYYKLYSDNIYRFPPKMTSFILNCKSLDDTLFKYEIREKIRHFVKTFPAFWKQVRSIHCTQQPAIYPILAQINPIHTTVHSVCTIYPQLLYT